MNDELLIAATEKLIGLKQQACWSRQLLHRAPPVLWFGNTKSSKPKVLTVGANPSRSEFLKSKQKAAINLAVETDDQSKLMYLSKPRFRVLRNDEPLEEILNSQRLREELTASYDSYFSNNPYHWFGREKELSFNVEGFLKGFGASYFEPNLKEYSALHVDLFPFTTLKDFKDLPQ